MSKYPNHEVRVAARVAGVALWRIAYAPGISEPTMTRWLRTELPDEKRQRILAAIAELSEEADE